MMGLFKKIKDSLPFLSKEDILLNTIVPIESEDEEGNIIKPSTEGIPKKLIFDPDNPPSSHKMKKIQRTLDWYDKNYEE